MFECQYKNYIFIAPCMYHISVYKYHSKTIQRHTLYDQNITVDYDISVTGI